MLRMLGKRAGHQGSFSRALSFCFRYRQRLHLYFYHAAKASFPCPEIDHSSFVLGIAWGDELHLSGGTVCPDSVAMADIHYKYSDCSHSRLLKDTACHFSCESFSRADLSHFDQRICRCRYRSRSRSRSMSTACSLFCPGPLSGTDAQLTMPSASQLPVSRLLPGHVWSLLGADFDQHSAREMPQYWTMLLSRFPEPRSQAISMF